MIKAQKKNKVKKSVGKKYSSRSATHSSKMKKIQIDNNEIVLLLKNLKTQIKEISQNQSNRVQADIMQLIEDFQSTPGNISKSGLSNYQKAIHHSITQIQDIKLKPEKGRLKDLRKATDIIKSIRQLLDTFE